jgi:hypothetical protein
MATVKSSKSTPSKRPAAPLAVDVAPRGDVWQIKREGASRASSVHESKAEAVSAASQMMRRNGGLLRVHARNGCVQQQVTIGRKAAAKISAVEGIKLDSRSRRHLVRLDRDDVSVEERRTRMIAGYGSDSKRSR